jgi:GntR family transcriptional repressor for pyruvate dehydrogenase complex
MSCNVARTGVFCIMTSIPTLDWMVPARDGGAPSLRLADSVIAQLSNAIVEGRLKPGDRLPSEAQIALSFGVSKPVAREALRELAALGVVQVHHGKATRVGEISVGILARFYRFAIGSTADGLRQAIELRRILEPQLAKLAAERRTPADCETLRALIAQMDAARGDVPRWIEADLAFHNAIAVATHNRLLILQMSGLRDVFRGILEKFNSRKARTPADWRATFNRHVLICDAIVRGDQSDSVDAMTAHFEAAEAAIAELFPT